MAIPTFSKEVIESFAHSIENDRRLDIYQDNIKDFWTKTLARNPQLKNYIQANLMSYIAPLEETGAQPSRVAANAFLEGIYMIISLVERQQEVDELEEMFDE
jgi:hypothetical protein